MSKQNKLIDRFLSIPSDFTCDELSSVLRFFGFNELKTGKTGGSRRRFVNESNNIVMLHKPHPGNTVKKYAMNQVIDYLKEKGKI